MSVDKLITENLAVWTGAVTQKSATGRGRNGKLEMTGIRKLRELILELAVRGKLVSQVSSDEPASLLLDRIATFRAEAIATKGGRKPKAIPPVEPKDELHEIPANWTFARLGHLVEIVRGITFPASEKSKLPEDGRIACLRTSNVQEQIEWDDLLFIREKFVSKDEQFVRPNDIVMSMANSRELVGKVALVGSLPHDRVAFGGFLGVLRPIEVHPAFVMALLRSPHTRAELIGNASQTTNIANISVGKLNPLVVALPPLAEQHRIVAKVDELMALCDQLEQQQSGSLQAQQTLLETLLRTLVEAGDAGETQQAWNRIAEHFDTLFTTEESIDQLKHTILRLAVMGKLVPQIKSDPPVDELLSLIAGQTADDEKGPTRLTDYMKADSWDQEQIPKIPNEWRWVRLGSLITQMDAGWSPACPPNPSPNDDVWGVLKTTAVQVMDYLEYENKMLPRSKQPKRQYEVRKGDILITRAGPKNRVAISCLVENTRPRLMISDKIIRFHLVEAGLCERYISLCLNAGATAEYLEKAKSGMAESQMNISQNKLKMAPIPICPTNEQHRIIAKVDALLSICDTLKTRIQQAQITQTHLADAIVEQAVA